MMGDTKRYRVLTAVCLLSVGLSIAGSGITHEQVAKPNIAESQNELTGGQPTTTNTTTPTDRSEREEREIGPTTPDAGQAGPGAGPADPGINPAENKSRNITGTLAADESTRIIFEANNGSQTSIGVSDDTQQIFYQLSLWNEQTLLSEEALTQWIRVGRDEPLQIPQNDTYQLELQNRGNEPVEYRVEIWGVLVERINGTMPVEATQTSVRTTESPETTVKRSTQETNSTSSPRLSVAREGAQMAIEDLRQNTSGTSKIQESAAIQAATDAVNLSRRGTPAEIRAATYGAVYGALNSSSPTLEPNAVYYPVYGAAYGGLIAATGTDYRLISLVELQETARGGAKGVVQELRNLEEGAEIRDIESALLIAASFGGAEGAITGATSIRTSVEVPALTPEMFASAAAGGSSGALRGAYHQQNAPIPRTHLQTRVAAKYSSYGAIAALAFSPELSATEIHNGAQMAALTVLDDPALQTRDQIEEASFSVAIQQFSLSDPSPALFDEPLLLTDDSAFPLVIYPRDLDGDGLYEDVNGNGILTYLDVVALSAFYEWGSIDPEMNLSTASSPYSVLLGLDFNGDCFFDQRDILTLDNEITGGPYENQTKPAVMGTNMATGSCTANPTSVSPVVNNSSRTGIQEGRR